MDESAKEQPLSVISTDSLGRKRYTKEFKRHLVDLAGQSGASVARIAMQAQINANLLHKWIVSARSNPSGARALLPVNVRRPALADAPAAAAGIEIVVNGATITIGSSVSCKQLAAVIAALRA